MSAQMDTDAILDLNQRMLSWCDEYSQELGHDIAVLKREHAIDAADDLRHSFNALEQENRLLQIGIIGRVKSGKSSLLNALVFNGENILPRAATPMTAALTTLTWAESFHAKVDFYSSEDIANLSAAAQEYERLLEQERNHAREQLQTRKTGVDLQEQAEKNAQRAAAQANPIQAAAHDQWQRIRKANIDPATLESMRTLRADDARALAEHLQEFVGADGRYMPLTKSVDIFLPLESLRDVRIIDTPGFNDPVQSREERTTALLKDCDVVLVVSPAGQFLSEQDIELMNRLTQKEGIQELVVVASQVDNQLYGSEKQETLRATLERITGNLGQHMRDTLIRMKSNNKEIGTVFDSLIEQGRDKILHTSGICHNLSMRFDRQQDWDPGERKVWENLQFDFPDFFVDGKTEPSCANLDLLSNIPALHGIVDTVRKRKDDILSQRRTSLVQAKAANLAAFHKALLDFCHECERQLNETDLKDLKKQRQQMDSVMATARRDLDDLLDEHLVELGGKLRTGLNTCLKTAYDEVADTATSATSEKIEIYTRNKKGVGNWIARKVWGGGQETYQEKVQEVYSIHVRAAVETFITSIGADLHESSDSTIRAFRRNLEKNMARIAREHLGDELDAGLLVRSVSSVVGKINLPAFELGDVDLGALKTGKNRLRGDDADRFLERASTLMADLRHSIAKTIVDLARSVASIPRTLGGDLFSDMQQRIVQLEHDIEHKTQTLDRLQRMRKSLAAIEVS